MLFNVVMGQTERPSETEALGQKEAWLQQDRCLRTKKKKKKMDPGRLDQG